MGQDSRQPEGRGPSPLSRRDFLQRTAAGIAAAGLAGSALAAPPRAQGQGEQFNPAPGDDVGTGMPYMGIPACQIRISRVAMGPASEAVQTRMIQYGCNYLHKVDGCGSQQFLSRLDWDAFYCDVVLDKTDRDEAIQEFERRRAKAGLDVIHFFKIHATLSKPEQLQTQRGIFEAFETLRDQGKTKWLATSLHAGPEMVDACVESGLFTQIQIGFNPLQGRPPMMAALAKAQQRGIGIMSMKPLMGGPAKWENNPQARQALQQYWPEGTSAAQAVLRWNLAQTGVTAIVPMCGNTQQADENCAAAGAQLQAWENTGVEALASALSDSFCRSCRTCEEFCPVGLPIADLLRYRMYAADYGETKGARALYRSLPADQRASLCTNCGACDRACPNAVRASSLLAEVHGMLA